MHLPPLSDFCTDPRTSILACLGNPFQASLCPHSILLHYIHVVAREKCFTNNMVYEGSNSRSRIRLDRVQAHTPDLKLFHPRSTLKIGPPEMHPILVHPHIYHPKSVSTPTPLVSGPSFQATLKKSAPYRDPKGSTLFY